MSAVTSGQNHSGNAERLDMPSKPALQSKINSSLQVVADRSSPLSVEQIDQSAVTSQRLSQSLVVVEDASAAPEHQLVEIKAYVWQWLKQRSSEEDFELLLLGTFFNGVDESALTQQQSQRLRQLMTALVSGDGLPQLDIRLSDSATMQGLVGAYASLHPSGHPTVLINQSWFEQATDHDRVVVLLQELGHGFDDQLNTNGWDTAGDEGALFAARVISNDFTSIPVDSFAYDDHVVLLINGQPISVQGAANKVANFSFESDLSSSDWNISSGGIATVTATDSNGFPANGSNYLSISGQGASTASGLEALLGITSGKLAEYFAISGYNVHSGTAVYQDLKDLSDEISVSFDWSFVARDYGNFNDGVFYSISRINSDNTLTPVFSAELADNKSLTSRTQDTTAIFSDKNAMTVNISLNSAGNYRLGYGAVNVGDNEHHPSLYVDNVVVAAINSAPVISGAGGTLSFKENDGAKVIDADLTITDVDDTNIESATVTISSGFQSAQDVLACTNTNVITGSWNASTGALTLSGSATKAQYEAALESVTYNNTSENPNTTNRSISWLINDGSNNSSAVTSTISLSSVDDPAIISGDTSGSGKEETTITGTLSATDVEGLTDNTYFSIASNHAPAKGTASINAKSGAWTYAPNTNYFGSDSFTVTVTDDLGGTTQQAISLTITPVNNDAPLGQDGSISLREDTVYSFELSDFPLNDPDKQHDSLTNIKLVNMPDRGQLMLNDQPIESVYTINFENASLSGWQILGDVTINSTDEQTNAPAVSLDPSVADTYYALLSTDSNQSVQQVEGFLGLSSGFFNSFTSSQDASTQFLDASGLKRTVSVIAGQQLEFDWKFLAGDELPYNDTFFTIAGSDVFSVASVYSVGDYGEEEGTFSYVFSKSGDYIIGAAVMDGKDSSGDTYLSVDNFRLTGVTQSSKAEDSGFTQIPYDLKASDVSNLKFDPGLNASNEPFANIKYQVEDSTGRLSNPVTLTVNVEPVNDVPIVTPDSFEFEINETDGLIKASGSMLLRDVDDVDRLSVRVSSITAVGNPNSLPIPSSLTSDNYKALLDMLLFKERSSSNSFSKSLDSLAADEPAGSIVDWEFNSGSSGDLAFDFLAKGETLKLTYVLNVSDNGNPLLSDDDNPSPASVSPEIKITIVGTNDTPYIVSGDDSASLVEDSATTLSIEGRITFSDVDLTDTHTPSVVAVDVVSETGHAPSSFLLDELRDHAKSFDLSMSSLSSSPTSHLDWSFTLPNILVDYLDVDDNGNPEKLDVTYRIAITDDSSTPDKTGFSEVETIFHDVKISISGHDDQLRLADIPPAQVTELDQSPQRSERGLDGLLDANDPESLPLVFGIHDHNEQAADGLLTHAGLYGTLQLEVNTGAYRYDYNDQLVEKLDKGESRSEEFLLTVTNSENEVATKSKSFIVNLVGADDAPVLTVIETGLISEITESSQVTQSALTGRLNATDVDGDVLSFGVQNGFDTALYGISSIESVPSLISSIDTSGSAWGVTLSPDGNFAFVADSYSGLQIIDVSNPSNPSLTATFNTTGYSSDVALSTNGTIAFVADGESGLQIIDISNPVNPALMATLDTSGYSIDVTLSADGKTAFIADSSSGLQIIDVSKPAKPVVTSTFNTSGYAMDVTLSPDGNTVFIANYAGSSGFQIVDVSNLASPRLIGSLDTSAGAVDLILSSDGKTAFVVDYEAGLQIIDINDPSKPSLLATYNPSGTTQAVTLSSDGKTAILAEDAEGIHVLDITIPSAPTLIGIIDAFDVPANDDVSAYAVDLTLTTDGNTAFVANLESGLHIFDVSGLSTFIRDTASSSTVVSPIYHGDVSSDDSSSLSVKQGDYGWFAVDVVTGQYSYTADSALIEALDSNEIVSETFTVTVNDGDGADVTEDFSVLLVGAADAPTISIPQDFELDEDSPLSFSNDHRLLVDDVDGNLSSVTFEVSHGRFLFETSFDVVSSLSEDASFIQITGNQSDLNSALTDLIYLPHQHFNGEDSLVVTAYDSSPSPLAASVSIPLTIKPVNDAPSSQSITVSLNEDQPYSFDELDFHFDDVDAEDYLTRVEIISLPYMGTLFLDESPLSFENPSDSLILTSDEISELYYMPRPDESGMNYDLFSFKVFDQGDLSSSPESISFNVSPVADLIDVVAIDNVVNRSEKAAGVTLSGTAEGADFVFVDWGGVEKIATVQDGIWSTYFPTVLNVTFDLGDFQTFSFSEVTLAEVFAAFPELSFDDVMSFNIISTEVPNDEDNMPISVVAMSSYGELIGSQVRFVTVDTTPPPTPKVTSLAGNSEIDYLESRERIFVEGYSEPLNTLELTWDRTSYTTTSDEDGYWSASIWPLRFEDGLHQMMFTVSTDPAGNASGPAVDLYGVDTDRPPLPSIDDITSDDVINISEVDSGIYLSGDGERDSRIILDWNDSTFITYADVFDRWEIYIPSNEFSASVSAFADSYDDIHSDYVLSGESSQDTRLSGDLSITSVDLFGNSSSTRTVTPVFDLTSPDPPVLSSEYSDSIVLNSASRSSGFALDGSAEPSGEVFIRLGYSTWIIDVDKQGKWSFDLPPTAVPFDSTSHEFEFNVIDSAGNHSDILTVPVVIDSISPKNLSIEGTLFGDNAISPDDLLNPILISGTTSSDASVVELSIFNTSYSTVPDSDGVWSFVVDPSDVPNQSQVSSLHLAAVDEHSNRLTKVYDFVVAMEIPESPEFKSISNDGFLNYADSFTDITVEGIAPIDHYVKVGYRDRVYHTDVDERGFWSLLLPFPGDNTYPISATSYFDPSHESQPASSEFVVDTKSPRVIGAELSLLDDALIRLEFDEELSSGSITHSDLRVLMDYNKTLSVNSARVSSDGYYLEISLRDLPSSANELAVTYMPSSSSSFVVKDIAGNPAQLILNYEVNNLISNSSVESLAGDFKSVRLEGSDSINAVANYSNNTIIGNDGNNVIEGLPGADTLTGGIGSDRFVYRNAFDSFLGDSNPYFDQITDFNPAYDVIQLPSQGALRLKSLTPLTELTDQSVSDAFIASNVEAHEIILFEVGESTFIVANDGDSSYSVKDDILIELTGAHLDELSETNFILA